MSWHDPQPGLFEQEALRHLDLLYGFALKLCGDRALAQDLVQETYLKALRARDSFSPGTNLRAWLAAILRNTYLDHCRRDRRIDRGVRAEDLALTDPSPGPAAGVGDPRLEAALAALPRRQRTALWLSAVEGFTYGEIAQALGCPSNSVGVWVARAKAGLRRELREDGQ